MIISFLCALVLLVAMGSFGYIVVTSDMKVAVQIGAAVFIIINLVYASIAIAADLGSKEVYDSLITILKTMYNIFMILVYTLFGLAVAFLIFLFTQPMGEMVALFIGITLYVMFILLIMGLAYVGVAVPAINLYDIAQGYAYAPVSYNIYDLRSYPAPMTLTY